ATTFGCGDVRCLLGQDLCLGQVNNGAGGMSGNRGGGASCTALTPACQGLPTCDCVCPGGHCAFGANCTCTRGAPGAVSISCDTGGTSGGAGGIGGGGAGGGGGTCPYGFAGMSGSGGTPAAPG